ncbi:hypothetical protein [Bifidobacterium samirii]|uniref:Uncharacterized protein n=1 Tax=Bifidobacterium samirii TaxID=2306974 RepID=A0A430FUJ0_9BIFI|nr:hypothetical protein [Bifidobacterium samirii]RSX56754.1 hypothetical protein D2E24_1044 [Bifidobacterium samirii]
MKNHRHHTNRRSWARISPCTNCGARIRLARTIRARVFLPGGGPLLCRMTGAEFRCTRCRFHFGGLSIDTPADQAIIGAIRDYNRYANNLRRRHA